MREQSIELKVGIFIFIGFTLLFLIVFSIGDIKFFKSYYRIKLALNFASGIGHTAPVRLCGVTVGEVENLGVYYDEASKRSKVELGLKIDKSVKLEKDAKATINTLGLLGEKYVEVFPGKTEEFLKEGDYLVGQDPVTMEEVTSELKTIVTDVKSIIGKMSSGQGTMGKLISDDKMYNEIDTFLTRLNSGQGTIGKFLTDDTVYNNFKDFSQEIKESPWKLLFKEKKEDTVKDKKSTKGPKKNF